MLNAVTDHPEHWNRFVLDSGGGFLQSWEWGHFQGRAGKEVYRYRLDLDRGDAGPAAVCQFMITVSPLPLGQRYGFVPMGPALAADRDRGKSFTVFVGALREAAARRGLLFTRIEPWTEPHGGFVDEGRLKRIGFVRTTPVSPDHTLVVDLTPDESVLLKNMKQKTRYNIRLAGRRGVKVREADYGNAHRLHEDIEAFVLLLNETTERDRFSAHPDDHYRKMVQDLAPRENRTMCVRLLLAEVDGEPAAAALLAEFGDTVTYLHGASSYERRSAMAPFALHWEAMRRAKERGLIRYDFWGVAPEGADESHPWHGITRFKLGFGGERIERLGTWDLPRNHTAYRAYMAARRLNRVLRQRFRS
ncbi:lipid II:glycine glycyltransferase FemX [Patescibacteria group bacterium]